MNNQRKLLALKVQGDGRLDSEGCVSAIHAELGKALAESTDTV